MQVLGCRAFFRMRRAAAGVRAGWRLLLRSRSVRSCCSVQGAISGTTLPPRGRLSASAARRVRAVPERRRKYFSHPANRSGCERFPEGSLGADRFSRRARRAAPPPGRSPGGDKSARIRRGCARRHCLPACAGRHKRAEAVHGILPYGEKIAHFSALSSVFGDLSHLFIVLYQIPGCECVPILL